MFGFFPMTSRHVIHQLWKSKDLPSLGNDMVPFGSITWQKLSEMKIPTRELDAMVTGHGELLQPGERREWPCAGVLSEWGPRGSHHRRTSAAAGPQAPPAKRPREKLALLPGLLPADAALAVELKRQVQAVAGLEQGKRRHGRSDSAKRKRGGVGQPWARERGEQLSEQPSRA